METLYLSSNSLTGEFYSTRIELWLSMYILSYNSGSLPIGFGNFSALNLVKINKNNMGGKDMWFEHISAFFIGFEN